MVEIYALSDNSILSRCGILNCKIPTFVEVASLSISTSTPKLLLAGLPLTSFPKS